MSSACRPQAVDHSRVESPRTERPPANVERLPATGGRSFTGREPEDRAPAGQCRAPGAPSFCRRAAARSTACRPTSSAFRPARHSRASLGYPQGHSSPVDRKHQIENLRPILRLRCEPSPFQGKSRAARPSRSAQIQRRFRQLGQTGERRQWRPGASCAIRCKSSPYIPER